MAIDFSQVKAISIPDGDVKQVSIGGTVVWKYHQEPEWHTIWSGSKTAKSENTTNSGTSNNFCSTAAGTGYTPKIRVTFSFSFTKPSYYTQTCWNNNANVGSNPPTSPLTINSLNSANTNVVGSRITKYTNSSYSTVSGTNTVYLTAHRDTDNNCVYFNLEANFTNKGNGASGNKVQMTITKIEQYY